MLASIDLCKLMADIEGKEPMDLAEHEQEIEYSFEFIREEIFLESAFGQNSRLEAPLWMQQVQMEKIAGWVFDSQMTRSLIFDQAGIENQDKESAAKFDAYKKKYLPETER